LVAGNLSPCPLPLLALIPRGAGLKGTEPPLEKQLRVVPFLSWAQAQHNFLTPPHDYEGFIKLRAKKVKRQNTVVWYKVCQCLEA